MVGWYAIQVFARAWLLLLGDFGLLWRLRPLPAATAIGASPRRIASVSARGYYLYYILVGRRTTDRGFTVFMLKLESRGSALAAK